MAAASCELTCMSGKVLLSFPSNPGRDRSRLRPLCYHLFPRRPSLPGVSVLHTPTAAVVFRLMATSGGICREGRGEQRDNACDLLQGQEFVEAVSQPQECLLDVSSRDDATLCQVAGRCGVRSRKIPVRGLSCARSRTRFNLDLGGNRAFAVPATCCRCLWYAPGSRKC